LAGLTLVGRARATLLGVLAAEHRLQFDADPMQASEEDAEHARKGSRLKEDV
jgi:hypothetical protein